MSSNSRQSEKEREILQRQRLVAARLKKPAGSIDPPGASTSLLKAPPKQPSKPNQTGVLKRPTSSSSSASAAALAAKTKKTGPLIDLTASPAKRTAQTAAATPKAAAAPAQKRPSKKKPLASSVAVAAAARAKASSATSAASATASRRLSDKDLKPSPKLQRKTVSVNGATSSLAKLVQHVSDSNNGGGDSSMAAALPNYAPDDFWKHLREWDFVTQYANTLADQKQSGNTNKKSSDDTTPPPQKSLPNTFLNPRHYVAAWAPLCLAECRAQLLQEATTSRHGSNATTKYAAVEVTVEATHSKARAPRGVTAAASWDAPPDASCHVLIRPVQRGDGSSMSFTASDLCLLIRRDYQHVLRDLERGVARPPHGKTDYRTVACVAQVEVARQELAGLTLQVSKRVWAVVANSNQKKQTMMLLKLGSNVTALREFTALCKVDGLPMKRFLLGQHLEDGTAVAKRKLRLQQESPEALLKLMGGAQALGQGFLQYARAKFNTSQLTAIAASAHEYGEGGFTLIKGPPGTGKTTTLVAVLNSLHIRQYNKYYEEVRRIAAQTTGSRQTALEMARRAKPRLLVCAPSNAAVDNVILKIMEDGFVDGQGQRYNPSMIRVGIGQGNAVRAVSLETKVDTILTEHLEDHGKLQSSIAGYRMELQRVTQDIARLRRRLYAIQSACPYALGKNWEIRVDEETFEETGRVFFVNHKEKQTTYDPPPPPAPDETQFLYSSMPEYRSFLSRVVKLVENYFSIKTQLERSSILKSALDNGSHHYELKQNMESHVLNSVHMVMTTLGTAGNRALEGVDKFEVVVVDEAAQSVEPASLSALQLGSRQVVLVGDPQQLPATIFNVSGRNSKYDRSLFQRLEEAGQPVYMLQEQYRMHPQISHFPRHIFYQGALLDGPNVTQPAYGNPLKAVLAQSVPVMKPFMILDLDSTEERGGTSLANSQEAQLAVYLYHQLKQHSRGLSQKSRVAVITPYAQQSSLLKRSFADALGPHYDQSVEVNTVDAFQGREANIVIFSAVRAAGSRGIGFLSDVRRMNVALTRAKHFLFVICRCESVVVNPYWKDLVQHARETRAVVRVPMVHNGSNQANFGDLASWQLESTTGAPLSNKNGGTLSAANPPRRGYPESHAISPPPPPPPPVAPPVAPPAARVDPRRLKSPPPPPVQPSDPRKRRRDGA